MDWPEITKDTPLEEIKRIHQQIWQYVVENGKKPETPYRTNCVLCSYVLLHKNSCTDCAVDWGNECASCCTEDTLYDRWRRARYYCNNKEQRKELAEKIRDIPFKYELEKKGAEE